MRTLPSRAECESKPGCGLVVGRLGNHDRVVLAHQQVELFELCPGRADPPPCYCNVSFKLSIAPSIACDRAGTTASGFTSVVQMNLAPEPPLGTTCMEA